MLCLHKGAELVSRDALMAIPTPPAIGRHMPIPHHELATTAIDRATKLGLQVTKEQWGVGSNGNRLYGVLDFKSDPALGLPDGMAPSMGIRSSHDKSLAINICVGARVFVCDNGAFLGDFSVRKLHTTGFRLIGEMDGAFRQFSAKIGGVTKMVENLRNRELSDTNAKALLVDAFRQDVMPWSYMKDVANNYFEPDHDEFKPRTAWSLYNAFTETFKQRSPNEQVRGFRILNRFLVGTHDAALVG